MMCYKTQFSDNRPMGQCNPTRMVEHYFPQSSFDVVRHVHSQLGLLQQLSKDLPMLQSVGRTLYSLESVKQYLGDIVSVANNLNNIVTLHNDLPLINSLAPRIEDFKGVLLDIQSKITYFDGNYSETIGNLNSKIKYIEDLYTQYECGLRDILERQMSTLTVEGNRYLNELSSIAESINEGVTFFKNKELIIKQYVDAQESLNIRLVHLEASDAVNIWLYTQTEEDFRIALKAIVKSEKYGNNESGNRTRLQYKKETNVFKAMTVNQPNVKIEKE